MPPDKPCHRGLLPQQCAYEHVAAKLDRGPSGTKSMRLCPCHDDHDASLSINYGTRGMRIVWHCGVGCAPADIRAELIARDVDESCLGSYGIPKPGYVSAYGRPAYSPGIIAAAGRSQAIAKLPHSLNGKLYIMCVQAILDGDGELPGDPVELLPVVAEDFYALADRAEIDGKYKYRLYKQWVRSDGF